MSGVWVIPGFPIHKTCLCGGQAGPAGSTYEQWFVFGNACSHAVAALVRTALEDVGSRVLLSTRVSPLSVVKIYNIFGQLSMVFMKFYVFYNGKSFTFGKRHKALSPKFRIFPCAFAGSVI